MTATVTVTVTDEVTRRILDSAKYRHLDPGLVRRLADEACQRFRNSGQAEKYARRKLHQAFGAFVSGPSARAVQDAVAAVQSGTSGLAEAGRAAMRAHASSAERLDWLDPFYHQVAGWCGEPRSVADLACGLNPLAIPWMRLAPGARYWACEIDHALVAALARLDDIMPARVEVTTCDLVASPPELAADVAFLLKTMTTMEQQAGGATARVLRNLACRHVIVSVPRHSLSGRLTYRDDAGASVRQLAESSGYEVSDEAAIGDELIFHLTPSCR